MSAILRNLIKEILSEADSPQNKILTPSSSQAQARTATQQQTPNKTSTSSTSQSVSSVGNVKSLGKSKVTRKKGEDVYDIVIDDLADLDNAAKILNLKLEVPDAKDVVDTSDKLAMAFSGAAPTYAHSKPGWSNTQQVGNTGWVIFGVSKYSPVDDMSSFVVSTDLRKAVENYKAYGHAYVLFVDEDGNSIRYDFGPSEKCGDVESDEQFEKIKAAVLQDTTLVNKIYNTMLLNRFMFQHFFPTALTAAYLPYDLKKKIVSAALSVFLNDMPMNFLPDIIHLLVPGTVWGNSKLKNVESPPETPVGKLVTAKSIINDLMRMYHKDGQFTKDESGYINYRGSSDSTKYIQSPTPARVAQLRASNPDIYNIKTYNIKIKDKIYDIDNIFAIDPRTQAVAGVRSENLSAGIAYCDKIASMGCNVTYAVPFPGFDLPKISGALNCGIFAANAFNASSAGAKISLSSTKHELVSPPVLFDQISQSADFSMGKPAA